jgi:hypothetical protein
MTISSDRESATSPAMALLVLPTARQSFASARRLPPMATMETALTARRQTVCEPVMQQATAAAAAAAATSAPPNQ